MIRELYDFDKGENTRYYSESSGISSNCSSPNSRVYSPGIDQSPGQITEYDFQMNTSNFYFENSAANATHFESSTLPQCYLNIVEQPTDKFRFRYKSEMHGTHGSLMGKKNEKSNKSYPSVELVGYKEKAIIRCSLNQTDITNPSPHSHRLVVRKDEKDFPDPHDLSVSKERGYTAQFQGMGIIHTAKKFIADELCYKKMQLIKSQTGKEVFTLKEQQQMKDRAEKEAKTMNLNQVRLCFEAFGINANGNLFKICNPVFSTPINNMKSALTGELKICRLSTAVSSASGGDDLFLLVEKVGKKNIKVRFYELIDEEVVWEAYGDFSEADVHHQYAIALRTPKYKNVNIDTPVDVFIELIRPSDNDRSEPRPFKYKPRTNIITRKRRRTSCNSSLSSFELPEPVAKGIRSAPSEDGNLSISEEFDKNYQIQDLLNAKPCQDSLTNFMSIALNDSDELKKMMDPSIFDNSFSGNLEFDGVSISQNKMIKKEHASVDQNKCKAVLKEIFDNFNEKDKNSKIKFLQIWNDFSNANENGDDILHDIILEDNTRDGKKLFEVIEKLKLYEVIQSQNSRGQTSLHFACLYNKFNFIRPLINFGCDPNVQDIYGNTALHIAVEENYNNCITGLLNKNLYNNTLSISINVNLTNDDGYTPLHLAIRKENLQIVKELIENGASTKISITKNGYNALHLAIESKSLDIVEYIINNSNVKITDTNSSGRNAIDLATSINPKSKIVEILLKSSGGGAVVLKSTPSNIKIKKENLINSKDGDDSSESENHKNDNINDDDDDDEDDDDEDDDDDADDNDNNENKTLQVINDNNEFLKLSDQQIQAIALILDNNNIWEKIATTLKLESDSFWSTSTGMLRHLSKQKQCTKSTFISALKKNDMNSTDIKKIIMQLNSII